jgi:MraZ protein
MESKEMVARTYYNSWYQHGVDEKRRVAVPAKWRPEKTGVQFTLILWPQSKEGACVRGLPPDQMAKLMRDLEAMANGPSKAALVRLIGAGSDQALVDKSGRICLPEAMAKEAAIEAGGEAVLVGLLDKFEIWNPQRYERVKAADSVMAEEALKMMA